MAPSSIPASLWRRTLDNDWRQPDTPQEVIVVESWSEGVMLGSLMIMAGITLANMRRRIWLHKLIFLEVSSPCSLNQRLADSGGIVDLGFDPRNLLLFRLQRLWLVPLFNRNMPLYLLLATQRHCLDQDQTVLDAIMVKIVHWLGPRRHSRLRLRD